MLTDALADILPEDERDAAVLSDAAGVMLTDGLEEALCVDSTEGASDDNPEPDGETLTDALADTLLEDERDTAGLLDAAGVILTGADSEEDLEEDTE